MKKNIEEWILFSESKLPILNTPTQNSVLD